MPCRSNRTLTLLSFGLSHILRSACRTLCAAVLNCTLAPFASAQCTTYLSQWGTPGNTAIGEFNLPYGLALDAAGNIYVSDQLNDRIQKFDSAGSPVLQWGTHGTALGEFDWPHGVATDTFGNVYVVDAYNNRVQKFNDVGVPLLQWGSPGGSPSSAPGEFDLPHGVATDATTGDVYVTDVLNHRIQKFDGGGNFLFEWGMLGSNPGELNQPTGVATDAAGYVYVTDYGNDRIQKFDSLGSPIIQWGMSGSAAGDFNRPYGVNADAAGNIYVADTSNHRIQKFTNMGTYLCEWGTNGTGNGDFDMPFGVATDAVGGIYVLDRNNNRVQTFSECPGPASGLTGIETSPGTVDLAWVDNASTETGYQVLREKRQGSSWINPNVTTLPANTVAYTATAGQGVWRYSVAPISAGCATTFTTPVGIKPAAPTGPAVANSGGSALVSWTDASNFETTYTVQRQQKSGGSWINTMTVGTLPKNSTNLLDSPGMGRWRYRILAKNQVGSSAFTGWVTITLP